MVDVVVRGEGEGVTHEDGAGLGGNSERVGYDVGGVLDQDVRLVGRDDEGVIGVLIQAEIPGGDVGGSVDGELQVVDGLGVPEDGDVHEGGAGLVEDELVVPVVGDDDVAVVEVGGEGGPGQALRQVHGDVAVHHAAADGEQVGEGR